MEQLGNIGTEVARAARAKGRATTNGLERALELFDLTIDDSRWRDHRLGEICRAREVVCDFIPGDNEYGSTAASLDRYFLPYAVAARSASGSRGPEGEGKEPGSRVNGMALSDTIWKRRTLILIGVGLLAACGQTVSTPDPRTPSVSPTRAFEVTPVPAPITPDTPERTPSVDDESPYGVFSTTRERVLDLLAIEFPTIRCDEPSIWDSLEPAEDGTPWEYLACSTAAGAIVQFITDPEGRLRSASAISVNAEPGHLPVLRGLAVAAAGPTGEGAFGRLQAALEGRKELVIVEGGYRFVATSPLESWMVDVTPTR